MGCCRKKTTISVDYCHSDQGTQTLETDGSRVLYSLTVQKTILSLHSEPLLLQPMPTTKKTVFASQDAVAECLPFSRSLPLLAQSSLDALQNTPVDPNNFKNHLNAKLDIFHIFLRGD